MVPMTVKVTEEDQLDEDGVPMGCHDGVMRLVNLPDTYDQVQGRKRRGRHKTEGGLDGTADGVKAARQLRASPGVACHGSIRHPDRRSSMHHPGRVVAGGGRGLGFHVAWIWIGAGNTFFVIQETQPTASCGAAVI